MSRLTNYHSGNFFTPPHPMVNGPIYRQTSQQGGFIQAYQPLYIVQGSYPGHPVPILQHAPVPPPSSLKPVVYQPVGVQHENVPKRENRPLEIIDPVTGNNVLKEILKNKESSLRETAAEFVPSTHCSNIDAQNIITTEETQLPELTAQDTVVDLNDTLDSDALESGLSFENTEDNPSLTASIKQIPSNLEQKLNEDNEIQQTSNFKTTILPKKQESHSSLPDAFRDESSRKRHHDQYSQSPPFSQPFNDFQKFHPRNFDPKKFERRNDYRNCQNNPVRFHAPPLFNRNQHRGQNNEYLSYNNERPFIRGGSERNLSTSNVNQPLYHHNRTFPANNSYNQKVDQECTAHPIKDLNENLIISESEKLKEPKYDENNNEITEESVNLTESSLLESTTENSESSLNLSCRYSKKKLKELIKSPLVNSKPPSIKDGLLDPKMNRGVWSTLFDDKNRIDEYSNEDNNNTSFQNNKSNYLKKTHSNMRYENNQNQLSRNKSGNEKQLIKMNLSIKEDVKLNKAENAWQPTHMKNPEAMDDKDRELGELLKNFRSLLNKITEENFEHLVKEINDKRKYMINSSEKLSAIVKLLFEKSISEPGYASTYAKLCHALSTVHLINEEVICVTKKTTNPWKIYLISHCQQEFERSKQDDIIFKSLQDQINKASDAEEIGNCEDNYFKIRQRANGTVKFIGELYKMNMLTASIMIKCIEVLITSVTEENIERLCKLLTTVGEKLESELKNKSDMDKYMQQLSKLKNSNVITTQRIKFDIMNVIDLRASRWRHRENARLLETKPQKLRDLQKQESKKERLMQQQLNDYQPKSNQNNLGRQRSQRSFDNDGFRVNVSKPFDFNKLSIPKTNNAEMSLGPPRNLFQNFHNPIPQMVPPPTKINNPYANLSTDCDDVEQLPMLHHTRSGSSTKSNRKDKKNGSNSQGSNNNNHKEKPKARTSSPVMEKSVDNEDEDDFFMIDMTDNEEKDMQLFVDKMQQTFKAKITFSMLVTDLKRIKITKNVLGQVLTDLFDKKSKERKELIELIGEICQKGLITKIVNVDALRLALKSIPTIICDVPLAYDYFTEYCVYFYENGLITTIDDIETICQNQQNALDKIKEKLNISNFQDESIKVQNSEMVKDEASKDLEQSEQCIPSKVKNERCLEKTLKFIQYKLEKKQKNESFLDEIYNEIDKEKCIEASNFIKDLTLKILKICYDGKGKKSQKKTIEIIKLFPLFKRYIDSDISSQIDCINVLNEFAFSNPNIENCNLYKLFELFYENDAISVEAFNIWKKQNPNSPSKREALSQTTSFFTRLEEADISDDFNCTSSTIKED